MQAFYGSWEGHLTSSGKSGKEPAVLPWLFSKPFRQEHPDEIRKIKERFTRGYLSRGSEAFKRQMRANTEHNTKGRLNQIKKPTMIMVGGNDELTPPSMAKELKSEMPNSKLLIFNEGGHGLYWELPHLFNKAVLDFLSSQV